MRSLRSQRRSRSRTRSRRYRVPCSRTSIASRCSEQRLASRGPLSFPRGRGSARRRKLPIRKKPRAAIAALVVRVSAQVAPERRTLRLLDLLEHLEDAFGRAHEQALVGLAEAAALERVAAGAGSFGHGHHLLPES